MFHEGGRGRWRHTFLVYQCLLAFGVPGAGKGRKDTSYPHLGLAFKASLLPSSLPMILLLLGVTLPPRPQHETPPPSLAWRLSGLPSTPDSELVLPAHTCHLHLLQHGRSRPQAASHASGVRPGAKKG